MFYTGWMVLGFMVVAGGATLSHWITPEWYARNLNSIRKLSYTTFALIYGGMILAGHILLKDWVSAVQYASIAIFIDLAILETPSILKIGNAEFKKNDQVIENTIRNNEKVILSSFQKTEQFTAVVQYTEHHFDELSEEQLVKMSEWKEFSSGLKDYLRFYTDTFGFKVSISAFSYETDEKIRQENIKGSLTQIEKFNSIGIPLDKKEEMSAALSIGEVYVVEEGKIICVPFFGVNNSFIVTVQADKDGAILNGIDAMNIVNLIQIFEWFVKN